MAERLVLVFEGGERRTLDDRDVVAREFVLGEQFADFQLDEFEQFRIVDHVALVQEHDDRGNADLTGQQDVLAGLRHRAVGRRHHQDRAVHLRRTGDHVLDVVGVARAVDVGVVAVVGLVFDVSGRDRDAARLLFRRLVDLVVRRERRAAGFRQHLGDRRGQRRLAVVDVTDGADVAVRLVSFKFCFGHLTLRLVVDCRQRQSGKLLLDFCGHVRRCFLVVIELHRKGCASLAHRAQVIHVAEHVHERHHRVDDVGVAAHVLPLDLPAPRIQVADDRTGVVFRGHHLDLHDRLEQHGLALRQRFAERRARAISKASAEESTSW